jgi:hypothetical protein
MHSVANLREEVLSQTLLDLSEMTKHQRFNPDKFAAAMLDFESKNPQIDDHVMGAVAAILCRQQDWAIEYDSKKNSVDIDLCNVDIDLASFEGIINVNTLNASFDKEFTESSEFLTHFYSKFTKSMEEKLPGVQSVWATQSTLLDYSAFMKSTGKTTSNMAFAAKNGRHFIPISSVNVTGEPLVVSLGIRKNLKHAYEVEEVKRKLFECMWVVSEFLNTLNNHLYNKSLHIVKAYDKTSNPIRVRKGLVFQVLVAIYFAWWHEIDYEDILFCMETYNNKKSDMCFNISNALEGNGKLAAPRVEKILEEALHEQKLGICAVIRAIGLSLIDCKIFCLTSAEKEGVFYFGLGTSCQGYDTTCGERALVFWDHFDLSKKILDIRKHKYQIFEDNSKTVLPVRFTDWESLLENSEFISKSHSSRYNKFYPYVVRNDVAFYPPFHGIFPMDICMTVHTFNEPNVVKPSIEFNSLLVKAQMYLPDLRYLYSNLRYI